MIEACTSPIKDFITDYPENIPSQYREMVVSSFFYGAAAKYITSMHIDKELLTWGAMGVIATTIHYLITPLISIVMSEDEDYDEFLDAFLFKAVIPLCLTAALVVPAGLITQAAAAKGLFTSIVFHLGKSAIHHLDNDSGSYREIGHANALNFFPL